MALQTSAGSEIYIGTPAADAQSDSYQAVAEVVDISEFGKSFQTIKHVTVNSRETQKIKGSFDAGGITLKLGRNLSDAGQAALKAALDSDAPYNIRVSLADIPASGSAPAPTSFYFKALVTSFTTMIGSADSLVSATVALEISGAITEVPATTGD
ncbi:hypothetical protein ACTL6U_21180 [Rhodovibrionaceae bacterium A322]